MTVDMGAIITTAGNLGGMALCSAAVLLLHREALKAFREELAAERKADSDRTEQFLERLDAHREHLIDMNRKLDQMYGRMS